MCYNQYCKLLKRSLLMIASCQCKRSSSFLKKSSFLRLTSSLPPLFSPYPSQSRSAGAGCDHDSFDATCSPLLRDDLTTVQYIACSLSLLRSARVQRDVKVPSTLLHPRDRRIVHSVSPTYSSQRCCLARAAGAVQQMQLRKSAKRFVVAGTAIVQGRACGTRP